MQQLWSVYINNMQNPTAQYFILTKILKTQKKMEREGGAPTTTGVSPARGLGNSEEGWGHIQCTSSSFRWLSSLQITIRGLWEGLNKLNYTHKELRTGLSDWQPGYFQHLYIILHTELWTKTPDLQNGPNTGCSKWWNWNGEASVAQGQPGLSPVASYNPQKEN